MDPRVTPGQWPEEYEHQYYPRQRPSRAQPQAHGQGTQPSPASASSTGPQPRRRRRYGPRKCRICLDEVQPRFDGSSGAPRYASDDPELGRLMSPCLCKGSQKYVHEGCLEAWRHAGGGSFTSSDRNLWQCPTCGFRYRLGTFGRLSIGRLIVSWQVNLLFTLLLITTVVFVLGYIGDFILDLYLDPFSALSFGHRPDPRLKILRTKEDREWAKWEQSWSFHFAKGFMSVGVLGFMKTWLTSPLRFFSVGGGRRRRGNGRDRYADLSWTVLVIGTFTAIMIAWRFVRSFTRRMLDRFKEGIVDIGGDNDDDDDEDDINNPGTT